MVHNLTRWNCGRLHIKALSIEQWVERINTREMPALTSTVRMLEQLAEDDTSSLQKLGQRVMHDSALTTSILRVANSASYIGVNRVTTVSRAAVVLGFKAIKNICITTRLLGSLLKNKDLDSKVYQRLLKLMARSFHAAILAKRMMADYDDDTQEEAFIAALLYNLGESAFWSMGGEMTVHLDRLLREAGKGREQIVKDTLGVSFDRLTSGLASSWHLSDILLKALKDPQRRTPELQVIHLANKCSAQLAGEGPPGADPQALLRQMSQASSIEPDAMRQLLAGVADEAETLLNSYGARALLPFIPRVGRHFDRGAGLAPVTMEAREADLELQIKLLRKLTLMASAKPDFNQVLQTTLQGIHRGLGMDRAIFFMIAADKQSLAPRQLYCHDSDRVRQQFRVDISDGDNVFFQAMNQLQPVKVADHQDPRWRNHLPPALCRSTSPRGFFLAPAVLDKQCLGLFFADCLETERVVTEAQFAGFGHFCLQANLCLAVALRKA